MLKQGLLLGAVTSSPDRDGEHLALRRVAAWSADDVAEEHVVAGLEVEFDRGCVPGLKILGAAENVSAQRGLVDGATVEEWKLFGSLDPEIAKLDNAGLPARIPANVERTAAQRLIETYRKSREARGLPVTPAELFMAIETDRVFRMPALKLAAAQREHDPQVYNYLFTRKSPALGGSLGACHALELGFVFGTIDSSGSRDFSGSGPAADALANAIQESWLAFARSGDPSNDTLGKWPVDGDARETMILGEGSRLEKAPYEDERRAWEVVEGAGIL